jgi:glycosyltransferase involved in cell wall biosynthesis
VGVSVVIPLYNKVETIARAIDSVLAQDIEHEILVVDDGSTDGSASIAESYKGNVKCVRQQNMGPSSARNRGAQLSRFPYLIFLDADDELLPGCLAAHLECRKKSPEVRVTVSLSAVLRKSILNKPEEFHRVGDFFYSHRFLQELTTGVAVAWICVDKKTFFEIDGFDPELRCWEITDFVHRLILKAPSVGFLGGKYVIIHKNPHNSQFFKTQKNAIYRHRFLQKVLDRISDVPSDQRLVLLRRVRESMLELLASGNVASFKHLAQQIRNHRRECVGFDRIVAMSYLPNSLLMVLVKTWRTVRSRSDIKKEMQKSLETRRPELPGVDV